MSQQQQKAAEASLASNQLAFLPLAPLAREHAGSDGMAKLLQSPPFLATGTRARQDSMVTDPTPPVDRPVSRASHSRAPSQYNLGAGLNMPMVSSEVWQQSVQALGLGGREPNSLTMDEKVCHFLCARV